MKFIVSSGRKLNYRHKVRDKMVREMDLFLDLLDVREIGVIKKLSKISDFISHDELFSSLGLKSGVILDRP